MATVHKEADVINSILEECEDDYVGLWSIHRRLKEGGFPSPKEATIELLAFLLWVRSIEPGVPDAQGRWLRWNETAEQAVERIKSEWNQLGRDPTIGDIVWFTTPIS